MAGARRMYLTAVPLSVGVVDNQPFLTKKDLLKNIRREPTLVRKA